jgi:hypothetical protein
VYIVERMKGPGWRRGLREFIIFVVSTTRRDPPRAA